MPTLAFFIIFYFAETTIPFSGEGKLRLLGLIFISTFAFPFGSIILLHTTALIGNLQVDAQTSKPLPYVTVTVFYTMITYFFIDKVGIAVLPSSMIIAVAITTAIATILTTFVSISIHSTAIGGVLGILFCIKAVYYEVNTLIYPITFCIILAGLTMTARLSMHKHTPLQVFAGLVLGFTVCFSVLFMLI
jgi:membrane-associated phospholipid phosphatase